MKASIGIITPPRTKGIFQAVEEQMRQRCDITYLTYSTTMELTGLYLEQASRFDGFLFSGNFPRDYIVEYVCPITKPYRYLKLSDRDCYRAIARIYAHSPQMDFSRVSFDCKADQQEELNRVFEDVFPPDRMPRLLPIPQQEQKERVHRQMLEQCRQVWQRGEIDLVVTRMSNLGPMLEQEGIPHVLLQPGTATVMECFSALLSDIQAVHMERALTACCVVRPAHETPAPEELAQLERTLERFNAEQNRSFVLRREGVSYDAITSGAAARELTCGYTGCLLTACLQQELPFAVCVGWGQGYDLMTAHQNALRALREVQRDGGRNTYLVNESYEMVGPLCGERTIRYQIRSEPRVNQLAKKLGVAPVNLEKLISLQKKKGMTEFSASDLVFYLDITPRSAARILRRLEESGNAVQVSRVHLNGRGRPAAIYRIDLGDVVL